MENKFQTSFIPKKPVIQDQHTGSGISLFLLLSIIVFLVSLGLAGWVFIQKDFLINAIKGAEKTIKTNKDAFEINTIEDILLLGSRIKSAEFLLDKHNSIQPIFSFIEFNTLKSVRFKNFHFSVLGKDESGAASIKVTMAGQTKDFKTIASQAAEFGNIDYRNIIKNPVFADLNLNGDGSVSFTVSMVVVPDFISYSKKLMKK